MQAFIIPPNAPVLLVSADTDWSEPINPAEDWITFTGLACPGELMFFAEDIRVDPVGQLGQNQNPGTRGGCWERTGWYGFACPSMWEKESDPTGNTKTFPESKGKIVLVEASRVITG
jgi:hypothetical protein